MQTNYTAPIHIMNKFKKQHPTEPLIASLTMRQIKTSVTSKLKPPTYSRIKSCKSQAC